VLSLALLAAWVGWLCRASIPRYEATLDVSLAPASSEIAPLLIARFPSSLVDQVVPGHRARVRLGKAGAPRTQDLAARVIAVVRHGHQLQLTVRCATPVALADQVMPSRVEVEAGAMTPGQLLVSSMLGGER
jgi:hypothetical protein